MILFDIVVDVFSGVVFLLLTFVNVKVAQEQSIRSRPAQCKVAGLFVISSLLRAIWLFCLDLKSSVYLIILNRISILFSFSGVLFLIYLWTLVLSGKNKSFDALFGFVLLFSWVFLIVTDLVCVDSDCIWYKVNLIFITVLSMFIVLVVLLYGYILKGKVSALTSDRNSEVHLKIIAELQFVCTVLTFCFTMRAISFAVQPLSELSTGSSASWFDPAYPWTFYQVQTRPTCQCMSRVTSHSECDIL